MTIYWLNFLQLLSLLSCRNWYQPGVIFWSQIGLFLFCSFLPSYHMFLVLFRRRFRFLGTLILCTQPKLGSGHIPCQKFFNLYSNQGSLSTVGFRSILVVVLVVPNSFLLHRLSVYRIWCRTRCGSNGHKDNLGHHATWHRPKRWLLNLIYSFVTFPTENLGSNK